MASSTFLSLSEPLRDRLTDSCLALPRTHSLPALHSPPTRACQPLLTLQEGAVAVADGRRDVHQELPAVPEHEQSQLPFRLLDQLPRVAQRQVLARYPIDLKGTKKKERTCVNER